MIKYIYRIQSSIRIPLEQGLGQEYDHVDNGANTSYYIPLEQG